MVKYSVSMYIIGMETQLQATKDFPSKELAEFIMTDAMLAPSEHDQEVLVEILTTTIQRFIYKNGTSN